MFCSFFNLIHGYFLMQILNETIQSVPVQGRTLNPTCKNVMELLRYTWQNT